MKLNARELREVSEEEIQAKLPPTRRRPIFFILENIYDTYNVGGLFRLADALAIERIYLCGEIEIPPHPRIKKASIGTYKVVPWEYRKSAKEAIEDVKNRHKEMSFPPKRKSHEKSVGLIKDGIRIIAVEQSKKAVDYTKADFTLPLALVFGNETSGISAETLVMCQQIAEIPMWGVNKSLNVIVSAAVVGYWIAGLEPGVGIGPTL
ncbi:hypothetical protein HY214_04125 [Candidatus Roizmanbacteria bacterium]|nr:hypothetical protein [Candidatus Roizmanbacteria bacterium]